MQLNWYIIYTKYNAELILKNNIDNYSKCNGLHYKTYLPLTEKVKIWRDRRKVDVFPLFRNYLFVQHDEKAFFNIKRMKGFCEYVSCGGKPSIISSQRMELIKQVVNQHHGKQQKMDALVKGSKVKICKGALSGYEGVLLDTPHKGNLMVEINSLKLFLNVQIPTKDVIVL